MNPKRKPRVYAPAIDGILPVDKPDDHTSHDVVARIRGRFQLKKVGHGGTLDPMATGLLVLLLGQGTKLSERIMQGNKVYEGTLHLGVTTNTQDAEGEVTGGSDPSAVTRERLLEAMGIWHGDCEQIPPMVSAIKKDGVPLYKHARKGIEIEREPRKITIFEFELLDFALPEARFRVTCSKGTYIRTLCKDIGDALGCGAHLSALRRTQSGDIDLSQATPLEELLTLEHAELEARCLPMENFIRKGPEIGPIEWFK